MGTSTAFNFWLYVVMPMLALLSGYGVGFRHGKSSILERVRPPKIFGPWCDICKQNFSPIERQQAHVHAKGYVHESCCDPIKCIGVVDLDKDELLPPSGRSLWRAEAA